MGQNRGRGGAILTPNELVLPFGGFYVCANFGENWSRNATVRVLAEGQIHTLTDANRFYNLSYAICYSYGTDNNKRKEWINTIFLSEPCLKTAISSQLLGFTLFTSCVCQFIFKIKMIAKMILLRWQALSNNADCSVGLKLRQYCAIHSSKSLNNTRFLPFSFLPVELTNM